MPSKKKPKIVEVDCPYCGAKAELKDASVVYGPGTDYGMIWICFPCNAYVGVHKSSKKMKPYGRLANKELRHWRMKAHAALDLLWQEKHMRRPEAYAYLAKELDIPVEKCHIGDFDILLCRKAYQIALKKQMWFRERAQKNG